MSDDKSNEVFQQLVKIFRVTGNGAVAGVTIEIAPSLLEKKLEPWPLQFGWNPFFDAHMSVPTDFLSGDIVRTTTIEFTQAGTRYDHDADKLSAEVHFEVERNGQVIWSTDDATLFMPKGGNALGYIDFAWVKERLDLITEQVAQSGGSYIPPLRTKKNFEQIDFDVDWPNQQATEMQEFLDTVRSGTKFQDLRIEWIVDAATRFGYSVARLEHLQMMARELKRIQDHNNTLEENLRGDWVDKFIKYANEERAINSEITNIDIVRKYKKSNNPQRHKKTLQAAFTKYAAEITPKKIRQK